MGAKAKKTAMKKNLKKASTTAAAVAVAARTQAAVSSELAISTKKVQVAADFLPLEGGPARKLPKSKEPSPLSEDKATVLYIGRIPHGFYENEMQDFFKQFGTIKRLRIARNKKDIEAELPRFDEFIDILDNEKTLQWMSVIVGELSQQHGNSKHFGFIEFESPEVAKIVADCMHNYLLFEHMLQVHLIAPEIVHPKLWYGVTHRSKPLNWTHIERKIHNKERTIEEHSKLLEGILKRDQKRRKRIEAAGIDYVCPELVGSIRPASKKIRFED